MFSRRKRQRQHGYRSARYAELRCKTNFSFLRGASHPEELAERAARLGYTAIAITDHNTLAGVVRMHGACKAAGIKLIVGTEITPVDAPPITLYATDRASYGRLCRIITQGRLRAIKGDCRVALRDIAQWHAGLLAVMHGSAVAATEYGTGLRACGTGFPACHLDRLESRSHTPESRSHTPESLSHTPESLSHKLKAQSHKLESRSLAQRRFAVPFEAVGDYRDIFGDRLYLSAGVHGGPHDAEHLAGLHDLSTAIGVPMIATNDVHYHDPDRRFLQDVLTCVREHCTLETVGRKLFSNAERHLKPIDELQRLFAEYPNAIIRTTEVADRCHFSLDELRYEYPEALCPPGRTAHEYLSELTWCGAGARYPDGVPGKVRRLIEHELALIEQLRYEPYFLTVWDIVRFARSRDILCQGRGSAANSAVCYCLGITAVDPDRIDLLFERFVSVERNEPPDIDVDFEHERREEVFQYIYGKYGREHAGIVAEVITYRPRSAIRDVGKALGLSLDRVGVLAQKHDWWDKDVLPESFVRETGLDSSDRTLRMLRKLVKQLIGFPRHLSQHVGGFVITRRPLCEMVPLENGAMPDRTFIEWDKDDIDALGILKIDCLALGMLTAIQKCFKMLGSGKQGTETSLSDVPPEDPAVYDMICRADTVGVFQIESRAQMSMLPRLKPRCFYDLVIEVAIVRPGPIQGGMVHPYLRRRSGKEPVTYPNDAVREALHKTLGVPLFQEQAMRLAVVAAGFTPGEADQLRRAMGAWRRNGDITRFRNKLIDGMKGNGLSEAFAERCFKQISGFGEYGFPESHAASFALLVYVSAWLKRYYPASFCAALINSQPMGFYQPAQLVRDAKEHGVQVLPIDVNESGYDCELDGRRNGKKGRSDEVLERRKDKELGGRRDEGLERRRGETNCAIQPARCNAIQEESASDRASPLAKGGQRGVQGWDDTARQDAHSATWGLRGPAVRLGMRLIKGIARAQVEKIERAGRERAFTSVTELAARSGATRATLARLAAADAMRSLGLSRREALWQVLALRDEPPLWSDVAVREPAEPIPKLPQPSLRDTVMQDYDTIGLSLTAHPIGLLREELNTIRVQPARSLTHARQGRWVRVAGLVLVRQRPSTALGIVFGTIEDETGVANLVIRPKVYEKYRRAAGGAVAIVTEGRVQREGQVVHVNVTRVTDLSEALAELKSVSRDFR